MIDDNVKDDPDRVWLSVLLVVVSCIDQIDQVLLDAEMGVDIEVVIDVVPVVSPIVVTKYRRNPDRCATQTCNIIEILGDTLDFAPIEGIIRCLHTLAPVWAQHRHTLLVVVKPVDHEKIDEFLAPFPVNVKIDLPRRWSKIDIFK